MTSLLPPNATKTELAIEAATARAGDLPTPLRDLWDPDTCPEALLPFLAWALSVDQWDPSWPVAQKREAIRASVSAHRIKGTPAAVRRALDRAGYPEALIIETWGNRYDGALTYDGTAIYEALAHWAEYRIQVPRAITLAQAEEVRRIAEAVAPARCHLVEVVFDEAATIYDGSLTYDGTETYRLRGAS